MTVVSDDVNANVADVLVVVAGGKEVRVTVGGAFVVNDQLKLAASGVPSDACTPVVTVAV